MIKVSEVYDLISIEVRGYGMMLTEEEADLVAREIETIIIDRQYRKNNEPTVS